MTVAPLVRRRAANFLDRIRAALAEGRPRDAAACSATGTGSRARCMHGEKRGRDLGFPTANMGVDGLHLPHSASTR